MRKNFRFYFEEVCVSKEETVSIQDSLNLSVLKQ